MRNFLMKFFLDQTVGSVMNIILFIVLINLLKGASLSVVWEAIGKVCTNITRNKHKKRTGVMNIH